MAQDRHRLLVGILYSGEPQLKRCVRGLLSQRSCEVGYFIVSHRSKMDAHNILYRKFNESGGRYDYLVKLDADVVLQSPEVFTIASGWMDRHQSIDVLSVPVLDSFTGRPIVGMPVYRPTLRFEAREDNLFTDRVEVPDQARAVDDLKLALPVLHAPDPSEFQAFHFGVHRGVKLGSAVDRSDNRYVLRHARTLRSVVGQARHRKDSPAHALALLGYAMGLDGLFGEPEVSYTNPTIETHFDERLRDEDLRSLRRRARLSIGRALVRRPRLASVMFLTAGRDAYNAARMRRQAIARGQGRVTLRQGAGRVGETEPAPVPESRR